MQHAPSRRRFVRRSPLFVAAVLVFGATVATADPTWKPAEIFTTRPQDGASGKNTLARYPRLARDPLGNVFLTGGFERYAVRPPGGPFGPISTTPGSEGINQDGNFVGGNPRLSFDGNGNALLSAIGAVGGVPGLVAVHRPAGAASVPGAPQLLGRMVIDIGEGRDRRRGAIAMNESGLAVAAWVETSASPAGQFVKIATRAPGAASAFDVDSAQTFPVGGTLTSVNATIDADGSAVVVWVEEPGGTVFQTTRSGSGGSFGAASAVTSIAGYSSFFGTLEVARNRAGDSVLTWSQPEAGRARAFASYRPRGGGFQAPEPVSPAAATRWVAYLQPRAAVLDDGTAIVACTAYQGDAITCPPSVTTVTSESNAIFTSSSSGAGWSEPSAIDERPSTGSTDITIDGLGSPVLAAAADRVAIVYAHERFVRAGGYCGTATSQDRDVVLRIGRGISFGPAVAVPGAGAQVVDVVTDAAGNVVVATLDENAQTLVSTLRVQSYDDLAPPAPAIASVSPLELSVGASLTVAGNGLVNKGRTKAWLDLAGKKLPLRIARGATAVSLTAKIASTPPNAHGACTLHVLVRGSKVPLTFGGLSIELPVIASVTPSAGPSRTLVTIDGTFFGSRRGRVRFGTGTGRVRSWTDTSITVEVPKGLAAGQPVDVVVQGRAGAVTAAGAFTPD